MIQNYIYQLIDKIYNNYGFLVAIGIEIEFFLYPQNTYTGIIPTHLILERGVQQYESHTEVCNLNTNLNQLLICKKKICDDLYRYDVIFDPKPKTDDYGSALQLNIHLYNDRNDRIFDFDEMTLLYVIDGILSIINPSLYLLTEDRTQEFERFTSGYMAPTHISWGKNNRTTAIRIPTHINKRIEFRIPSAACKVENAIIVVLAGILSGLQHKTNKFTCIYGNAYDPIYNLCPIYTSLRETKDNFNFYHILNQILTSKSIIN
jgi:glutamine synthetase